MRTYDVIIVTERSVLISEVERAREKGWELAGGTTAYINPRGKRALVQAIYKPVRKRWWKFW